MTMAVEARDRRRSAGDAPVGRDGDAALMRALAAGDESALADIYEVHAGPVRALAIRLAGARADDVVQEVFLHLWQRPEAFAPDRGSLRGYLLLTTRGRAIDLIRAEQARDRREMAHTVQAERVNRVPDGESDVLGAATWSVLDDLPTRERLPIGLAYLLGYTYREVALLLEVPEGTVKTRIRSGLARLGPLLVGRGEQPPMGATSSC